MPEKHLVYRVSVLFTKNCGFDSKFVTKFTTEKNDEKLAIAKQIYSDCSSAYSEHLVMLTVQDYDNDEIVEVVKTNKGEKND